jgi:DNA polymerase III subunit epsilon
MRERGSGSIESPAACPDIEAMETRQTQLSSSTRAPAERIWHETTSSGSIGWQNLPSSPYARTAHASAKQKLHAFLTERPAGADARELMGLLFSGGGSDPELGARIVHGLIGEDPNFAFDAESQLWSLSRSATLRVPLDEADFVVVDLETAAPRPSPDAIIEIGAYRMRGRRIVDSFESLLRPSVPIPRFVAKLTSITDEMVAQAPLIKDVLPTFRAFLGEAVLVAHNAQFDQSFLDFEFRRLFGIGLLNPLLCTLRMSRSLLPSLKRRRLDLLAEYFGLSTAGRHRGLGDARMAAELLSIFLEMSEKAGICRLDRLLDRHARSPAGRRLERHIAPETIAAMPRSPGVYLMRNNRGDLLYVGKAVRLRDRVASYFNAGAGVTAKSAELVSHVWAIETRLTRSALEAALLEARLIREFKPPYNRMLKAAAPAYFIRVELADPFPQLRASQRLSASSTMLQLGPFIGRRNIDNSLRALSRLFGLRTCSGRLAPDPDVSPCMYGQMGHCAVPCNRTIEADAYRERVHRAISFLRGRSGPILGELARARDQAASVMRFEEARRYHRDLEALATLAERTSRLSRVITENNLIIVAGVPHSTAAGGGVPSEPSQDSVAITESRDESGAAASTRNAIAPRPGPLGYSCPVGYVVLSGRLALECALDSSQTPFEIARFIADNYDLYKLKPVVRSDLDAMLTIARWLKERTPDDGRIIPIVGRDFDPNQLTQTVSRLASGAMGGPE